MNNEMESRYGRYSVLLTSIDGIVSYPEIPDAVRYHASYRRHDDGHYRGHGGHDRRLFHIDSQLPHVNRQVRIQHVQRCGQQIILHLYR